MTHEIYHFPINITGDKEESIAYDLNSVYGKINDTNPSILEIKYEGHTTPHGGNVRGRAAFCEYVERMNDEFWEKEFGKRLVLDGEEFVWKAP